VANTLLDGFPCLWDNKLATLRRDEISRRTRISDTVMLLWCCLFKLPVFVSRDDDNLLERLKFLRATAEPGESRLTFHLPSNNNQDSSTTAYPPSTSLLPFANPSTPSKPRYLTYRLPLHHSPTNLLALHISRLWRQGFSKALALGGLGSPSSSWYY